MLLMLEDNAEDFTLLLMLKEMLTKAYWFHYAEGDYDEDNRSSFDNNREVDNLQKIVINHTSSPMTEISFPLIAECKDIVLDPLLFLC